jgi:N-acylneuraminate cytidylyltransferase
MTPLYIIPARGGSKGIPRKNIKLLCGKPLIGYSIDVALALANDKQHIIVSTDDEEIAAVKNVACLCPIAVLQPSPPTNQAVAR